ncbi:alpha/beta hydrolase [Gemmatirosa kalamazoonensis]|uniref:Alpha/beta hydrolase n=1 Tax=Gemmatirosa kalamazoonensis TaxID=861299 RepID=W0RBG6_9BACT|nr:alpha/beta hydrolase [Gemmatirosa kalamazoonensis]AHG87792.1 alpha/beta hydrolase [Gemmatirosa kalamazoonensis]
MHRALASVAALALLAGAAAAQPVQKDVAPADTFVPRDAQVIPLWPAGAPGAVGDSSVDRPGLTVFPAPADRATGAAAVIFPGGGYSHLATGKEGVAVAHWLNTLGVTAFVATYRLGPRYHYPAMIDDGLRAVRIARARAAEWKVDPHRIGVVGFSAGGHLASSVGTHYAGTQARVGASDTVSARPDFMVLVYPVVTMFDPLVHRGSRTSLLGTSPDSSMLRLFSNETQVTRETPPAFIVASSDDATVPVENSIHLYEALRTARVPVELHVYEAGRHGFGLAPGDPYLGGWIDLAGRWLARHGLARETR